MDHIQGTPPPPPCFRHSKWWIRQITSLRSAHCTTSIHAAGPALVLHLSPCVNSEMIHIPSSDYTMGPCESVWTTLFILSNHPRWHALCLWCPMSTKQLLLSWQLLALKPSPASSLQPCLPPLCLLIQRCQDRDSRGCCLHIDNKVVTERSTTNSSATPLVASLQACVL